ncbi:hypothetical protein ACQ4PT_014625 [Festuca glaucescens]
MERGSAADSTPGSSGEARSTQLLPNLIIVSNTGGTMEGFLLRLLAFYLDGEDHDGTQDRDGARSGVQTDHRPSHQQHDPPNRVITMAGRMEATITALLSLLSVTLLAHALLLQPPRAAAVFADRFLSALRFDARQLVDLVNRRNMILLCHAILLLILRDAGLLAAPARRRSTATTTAAGGEDACSQAQPKSTSIGEMRRSGTAAAGASSDAKSATLADDGRVKLERRPSPGRDKTAARLRRGKPSPIAREIAPADKQRSERRFFDHGVATEVAAVEDKISCLHSEPVADDETSRGVEELARQETEPECVDAVGEMNNKFEEFIATMRRKMQLESLQPVKV